MRLGDAVTFEKQKNKIMHRLGKPDHHKIKPIHWQHIIDFMTKAADPNWPLGQTLDI